MNARVKTTDKEVLTIWERWLELTVVVGMLLLFSFFSYHLSSESGFFTDKFGTLEKICLFAPIMLSVISPSVRALTGRRNPARPFEAITNLCLGLGSLWLLIVFPFDFAYLGATLPESLRFLVGWVTDDIGRIPLVLQVIIGLASALLTIAKYFVVRRREADLYLRHGAS